MIYISCYTYPNPVERRAGSTPAVAVIFFPFSRSLALPPTTPFAYSFVPFSFFVIFHSAPNPEKVRPRKRQLGAIMYIIYATWLDHVYNLTCIEFLSILIHALGRIKTLPPSQPGCMSFRSDPPGTVHWESTLYIDRLSWVLARGSTRSVL